MEVYSESPLYSLQNLNPVKLLSDLSIKQDLQTDEDINTNGKLVTFKGTSSQLLGTYFPTFDSIKIETGATLSLQTGYTAKIKGKLIVDGTLNYTPNTTFEFTGNPSGTNMYITGATTSYVPFYNLYVNATGTTDKLIPEVNTNIYNTLWVQNGVFDNSGGKDIRLKSTSATETARLYMLVSGTSDYLGNITVERYLSSDTGWWMITCPLSGATLSSWQDNVSFWCGSLCNFYSYNESVPGTNENGYTCECINNNPALTPGKGFFYYKTYTSPKILDATKPPAKFTISLPVSYTSTGYPDDDGWNLVGNPYPCTIDWDAATGWTKTNIYAGIYIWRDDLQQYASYVSGGSSTNGGSRYIASGQAFWVKANASSPSLQATEDVKVDQNATFFVRKAKNNQIFQNQPYMEIKIFVENTSNGWYRDESVVRFSNNFTPVFDSCCDAYKLFGNNVNIFTCFDTTWYSINSVPYGDTSVRLGTYVPINGIYKIAVDSGYSYFASAPCLILEDLKKNVFWDLLSSPYLDTILTTDTSRFILHFGMPVNLSYIQGCTSYDIVAEFYGTRQVTWKDTAGNVLKSGTATGSDTLYGVPPGTYIVELNGGSCSPHLAQIQVPDFLPKINYLVSSPTCSISSDGSIILQYENFDISTLNITWSNGYNGDTLSGLSPGIYSVTVSDASCSLSSSITLTENTQISISTNPSNTTINDPANNCVEIIAQTPAVDSIVWYYDGNAVDYGDTFNYCFNITNTNDTFVVMAVAFSNICSDTAYSTVIIAIPSAMEIIRADMNTFKEEPLAIFIFSSDGKAFRYNRLDEAIEAINLLPSGVYELTVFYNNGKKTARRFIVNTQKSDKRQ